MMSGTTWGDKQFEVIIGRLLRVGVILAAAWVLVGGILYLVQYRGAKPDYRVFRGEPADLRYTHEIVHEALRFNARALIQFGLLLLIATPIARVAFSVIGFGMEKDWTYVGITLVVLTLLIYTFISS
jgi:uncharacterized membrane protein